MKHVNSDTAISDSLLSAKKMLPRQSNTCTTPGATSKHTAGDCSRVGKIQTLKSAFIFYKATTSVETPADVHWNTITHPEIAGEKPLWSSGWGISLASPASPLSIYTILAQKMSKESKDIVFSLIWKITENNKCRIEEAWAVECWNEIHRIQLKKCHRSSNVTRSCHW